MKLQSQLLDIHSLITCQELSKALTEHRASLAARFDELGGREMMVAYSNLTDSVIDRVFHLAWAEAVDGSVQSKAPRSITIAAVGGYGRQEMSPHSDVDVAFLVSEEDDGEIELVVKRAFRLLMEVVEAAGMSVGYSYRRIDEVEHLPFEVQTALLDSRRIVGSVSVFERFQRTLRAAITPASFVVAHIEGRRDSGVNNSTPFVVEPNIKEGYGGLRDWHAARWVARIAFGLSNDDVWYGLRSRGILLDSEMTALDNAVEFQCKVRNCLHLLADKGLETLNAERQEQVAESLHYESANVFIADYYRHAQCIWNVFRKVSEACLEAELEIEPGIVACDGRLRILDRGLLSRNETAMLRVFRHAQSFKLLIDRESRDMISAASETLTLTPGVRRCFVEILTHQGTSATLRSMAENGILQALIPQFGELMWLVPGDTAHTFTVGEHSLRAVEQLEALLVENNEQFAEAASRVKHIEVMFLATLLHDIGKLDVGHNHAKSGAAMAKEIASRMGMPVELCAKVEFLVSHHLKMSETARLRDLHRQKTITDFTSVVSGSFDSAQDALTVLDMLFLLTVADARAVGTVNWGRVQLRFLLELHERARSALRWPSNGTADVERHKKRVRRELELSKLPAEEVDEHCASMPASYLLNTAPEELATHIGYVRVVRNGSPTVEVKDDSCRDYTELTIVAKDKSGLLSEIAGVLHAMRINVHAAQIYTRHSIDEIAIDQLFIDFDGQRLTEVKKWELESELLSVLKGAVSVESMLQRGGMPDIQKPTAIELKPMDNLSDHETVLELRADDTPGLLYYLTREMSRLGWSIHSARVATWGDQAQDAFYVKDKFGNKLASSEIAKLEAVISAG